MKLLIALGNAGNNIRNANIFLLGNFHIAASGTAATASTSTEANVLLLI